MFEIAGILLSGALTGGTVAAAALARRHLSPTAFWALVAALLLASVAQQAKRVHDDWVYEEQNQLDQRDIAASCHDLEGQKLRYANGTRTDCNYAAYVLRTTAWSRAFGNWVDRLTTMTSLLEWVQAHALMCSAALVLMLVAGGALLQQSQHTVDAYRHKELAKMQARLQVAAAMQQQQQKMT
jgi:hypothetical protein